MEHPEGPGRPEIMRTWVERVVIPSRAGSALAPLSGPRFTADYKKRLHVPTHLPPLLSNSLLGGGGASEFGAIERVEDEDDKERWKSLSEKQWGDFMSLGFDVSSSPSSASLGIVDGNGKERRRTISKQLEFDLTESARKVRSYHFAVVRARPGVDPADFSSTLAGSPREARDADVERLFERRISAERGHAVGEPELFEPDPKGHPRVARACVPYLSFLFRVRSV